METPIEKVNSKLKTLSLEDFYIWISENIDVLRVESKGVIIEAHSQGFLERMKMNYQH